MPSPDGCYVQVWEQARLAGGSEFINGPQRYRALTDLPGRRSWKNRIRSLQLGPRAAATIWPEESFRGDGMPLIADGRDGGRFRVLPASVGSLEVRCVIPGSGVAASLDSP